jgi:hypothetical protein
VIGLSFTAGDAIAGLALVLSLVATITTLRFNGRQKSLIASQELLNRRLIEREDSDSQAERQADLGANLVKVGDSRWRVKVFNKGRAAARNVTVSDGDASDLLLKQDVDSKFPMEVLEPQQGVDLIALVHLGSESKHAITLEWEDDFSTVNHKTVYVTI